MQFIEATAIGARAARLSFHRPNSSIRITLFPVVHVGEPHFYEQVYRDGLDHDVVLFEGVRSPITVRITRSYRWLVGSRAMDGLVVQPKFSATGADTRIVHADLTHDEFEVEWRKIPLWIRLLLYVAAPIIGLRRRWFMSKADLAQEMRCEDQPSMKELLAVSPETGALTQAILHARDERLLQKLRIELERTDEPTSIAVIYGAAHMRAVLRELTGSLGFAVAGAEWRTVLSLD